MHIPKGQTPPNKESEDTNMTKNEERINKLFEELVPASGKAESLAGELIRAMSRIAYRFYNDGDQVGIGYGRETCNPAARFLMEEGNKRVSSLATAIWGIYDESAYENLLDILAEAVADYVEQTPDLRTTPTDDMWDYCTNEDVDDDEDEEEEVYSIVGTSESDPMNGRLSNESPVGKALIGAHVGDTVAAQTPGGVRRLRIVNIAL